MKKSWQAAAIAILLIAAVTLAFKTCADSLAGIPGKMIQTGGDATAGTLKKVTQVFSEALQLTPQVIQNHQVLLHQSAPIAELAILKKGESYQFTWQHTWLGSAKTIEVKGHYQAKAGFDLTQPFTVTLEKDGTVQADLPPARILSFERMGDLEIKDTSGWINKVTSEERTEVLNAFETKARAAMDTSSILAETEAQALQRLQELAARNGQEIVFRFRKPIPAPSTTLP